MKSIKYFTGIIFLLIIIVLLISCSNNHFNDKTYKDNTVTEENVMIENLKEIVPTLNIVQNEMEQYDFKAEFYYTDNKLIVSSKEKEDLIISNAVLVDNIKAILDNKYVSSVSWDYSQSTSSFYLTVGIKMVRSGYISVIMKGENNATNSVLLGSEWYYCEWIGE